MTKGPGRAYEGEFELHLCMGGVKSCGSAKKCAENQFHTDVMRVVTVDDLRRRVSNWWSKPPAKKDFETSRTRYLEKEKAKGLPAG